MQLSVVLQVLEEENIREIMEGRSCLQFKDIGGGWEMGKEQNKTENNFDGHFLF